jgi:peptidoglycan-associated lipoprotein
MRRVSLVLVLVAVMFTFGCSKSGKGGTGTEEGLGEGNIPLAEPGSELKDVNYDYDSSALSSTAQSILRENGRWLLDNPSTDIVVEGHCDERGTNEYNMALGQRRAQAATDFLRSLGVKANRMKTISYGEELPLDPGHNESAYAKNRRAHLAVQK